MESSQHLAGAIQSTLINPDVTRDEIIKHVEFCARYHFNAAMVAMCWVPLAKGHSGWYGRENCHLYRFCHGQHKRGGQAGLDQRMPTDGC